MTLNPRIRHHSRAVWLGYAIVAIVSIFAADVSFANEAAASPATSNATANAKHPKVIFLGFDGVDPRRVDEFIAQGHLPTLKRLRDAGGMSPIDTVFPPQSPVCWSSVLTGTNPGKHAVTGFVKRADGSYNPELGIVRVTHRTIGLGRLNSIAAGVAVLIILSLSCTLAAKLIRRPAATGLKLGLTAGVPFGLVAALLVNEWIPPTVPQPVNVRHGTAFFEPIAEAGHKVALLNTPMDWPVPQRPNVLEYAGFNVPDLRGTFGIYTFWTTDFSAAEYVKSEMGADVRRVNFGQVGGDFSAQVPGTTGVPEGAKQAAVTMLEGARDLTKPALGYPTAKVPLLLAKNEIDGWLSVSIPQDLAGEAASRGIRLKAGQWSDWITLRFEMNTLVKVNGRVRFFLEELSPVLRLYCTPVSVDPDSPAGGNQIANPASYGPEIQDLAGEDDNPGLDTLGWPELTHPLYDENLRDQAFMDHCLGLEAKRRKVLYDVLDRREHDLVCAWFYGPDRVQHMMMRYIDPQHPDYAVLQGSPLRDSILKIYQFMDETVARVLEKNAGPETLVLVASDHGFAPFRRAVSINRWLVENGYLVLKSTQEARHASDLFTKRDQLLNEIDWSRTRAYGLGLGNIYLNIRGRDPLGIVDQRDAYQLCLDIKAGLESLRDPANGGAKVVSRVYLRDGVHAAPGLEAQFPVQYGQFTDDFSELLVGFAEGYRVSWQTTLGYADEPVVFTNPKKWSGDHCSIDPALIPGVLFSNRALDPGHRPDLMSIAPTILSAFGLLESASAGRAPAAGGGDEPLDSPPVRFAGQPAANPTQHPGPSAARHRRVVGPGYPWQK